MSAANALSSGPASSATAEGRPAEPSMDDILASIRRIIADDQSRHAGAAAAPLPSPLPVRAPAPAAAPAPGPSQVRREPLLSRPVLPPQRPLSRPAVESRPPSTLLAGVAPHINPPPISHAADHPVIDEIASAGVAAALRNGSAYEPAVARLAEAEPVLAETPANDPAPAGEAMIAVPPAATAEPIEPISPGPAPPVAVHGELAPDPVPFFSPEPMPEPLVSAQARATIETSFHALSASIFMQNAGMVEGLARDMLRPMLKSWLDDNLPGIVERLVRQEIERVARGGRA